MGRRVRPVFWLALAAVVALWAWRPGRPALVIGGSMYPTLRNHQMVWVDSGYYRDHPLRRGDIVLFRYDGLLQVKRVHALPGELVWELHCTDTGSVFLADPGELALARRYAANPGVHTLLVGTPVPEGHVYLLGDGGNVSMDSRYYGPVPFEAVKGRVRLREQRDLAAREALDRAMLYLGGRRQSRADSVAPAVH